MSWTADLLVGSVGLGLAAGVAHLLLRLWRREPVASYRLLCSVLVATLVLPVGQVLLHATGLSSSLPYVEQLARILPALPSSEELEASRGNPREGAAQMLARSSPGGPHALAALDPDFTPRSLEEQELFLDLYYLQEVAARGDEQAAAFLGGGPIDASMEAEALTGPSTLADLLSDPADRRHLLLGAAAVYMLGLVISLGRMGARLLRTRRLLRGAAPVTDRSVLAVWSQVRKRSPLRGKAVLLTTPEIEVPMCYGLGRPVVLLPASEEPRLAPDVLACVLLHELVHLERKDTWVMVGQELLRSIFWFHPAAWWLSRRIDALRELSCDHVVVSRTGRRKRYASALVEYAAWMRRGFEVPSTGSTTALLPWTTSNSQLARRIEMLLSLSSNRRRSHATMLAAASAFTALWGGQLAFAAAVQGTADPVQDDPAPEVVEVGDSEVAQILELLEAIEVDPEPVLEPVEAVEIEPMLVESLQLAEPSEVFVSGGEPVELFLQDEQDGRKVRIKGRIEVVDENGTKVYEFSDPKEMEELGEQLGRDFHVEFARPDLMVPGIEFKRSLFDPRTNLFQVQGEDKAPMIGIRISDMEDDKLVIAEVIDGTLAETSGLQDEDVIVHIDGKRATWDNLQEAKKKLVKESIQLEVERKGSPIVIVIDGKKAQKSKEKGKWFSDFSFDAPHVLFTDEDGVSQELHLRHGDDQAEVHFRPRVFRVETDDGDGKSRGFSFPPHVFRWNAEGDEENQEGHWKVHMERGEFEKAKDALKDAQIMWRNLKDEHGAFALDKARKALEGVKGLDLEHVERFQEAMQSLENLHVPHFEGLPKGFKERIHEAAEDARIRVRESRPPSVREHGGDDVERRIDELRKQLDERRRELEKLERQLEELRRDRGAGAANSRRAGDSAMSFPQQTANSLAIGSLR